MLAAAEGISGLGERGGRVRCVVFDFDSTLTSPVFLERLNMWMISDKPAVLEMSPEETISNFGGETRIRALEAMLDQLCKANVHLFIVSIGLKRCILPQLQAVELQRFIAEENIFGQDSVRLRAHKCIKAKLIQEIMAEHSWGFDDVLFVDDSARHVEAAAGVCRTKQGGKGGLSVEDMDAIRRACLPPT